MSNLRHYQGIDFEVWESQPSWFWLVMDPSCDGGAVGSAASETDAVRDACLSIDAMMFVCIEPLTAAGWEICFANLERYLVQYCNHLA